MYDELIKRLWACASGECFNCSQYTETTNASVCSKELMKQAADVIEGLSKPKWIPVTERLPEDLTRVIVFCEDGVSFGLCEHLIADDEEVVEWHDFLHYPITPTHWMPLPEPPEDGE